MDKVTVVIRLLAEWIAIDHDETRLQWEKYQTEAQELADYLHVIGFRQCPTEGSGLTVNGRR